MKIKIFYITLIFLLLGTGLVHSQERNTEISVDFRVNDTHIDTTYGNNAATVSKLISLLHRINCDGSINIVGITFCGAASPEGSYEWNLRLAQERMKSLEELVRSKIDITDSIITYNNSYIPWNYLATMVRDSDISHKDEILEIISGNPQIVKYYGSRTIDYRVLRLKALRGGRVWKELYRRFFIPMRNASVVVFTVQERLPSIAPKTAKVQVKPDSLMWKPIIPSAAQWQRTLSVKTNAIGLCMAITNAAVEIDLCNHWSFNLPVYYSAWDYFSEIIKFRTLAIQPEIRYWFSKKNLENDGWFVGAHFGLAYYNIATDGEYRTQDHDGTSPALGGGLAVGYRMPISKNNRWKMEFSIGAGAYKLHHDKFHNYHNGLLVSTERKTYIGIDQASVSFSYTFDLKRKGGAR